MIKEMRYSLLIITVTLFVNSSFTMEFRRRNRVSLDENVEIVEGVTVKGLLNLISDTNPWELSAYTQLDEIIVKIEAQMRDIESPQEVRTIADLLWKKIAQLDELSGCRSAIITNLRETRNRVSRICSFDEIYDPCCIKCPCATVMYYFSGMFCCLGTIFTCCYYSHASRRLRALLNEINLLNSFGNNETLATPSQEYHPLPEHLAHILQL